MLLLWASRCVLRLITEDLVDGLDRWFCPAASEFGERVALVRRQKLDAAAPHRLHHRRANCYLAEDQELLSGGCRTGIEAVDRIHCALQLAGGRDEGAKVLVGDVGQFDEALILLAQGTGIDGGLGAALVGLGRGDDLLLLLNGSIERTTSD